jgi:hypothetical protein
MTIAKQVASIVAVSAYVQRQQRIYYTNTGGRQASNNGGGT